MARTRAFDHDAVLDAAIEQFWSSSYRGSSTEDLCATANLSRSSLYNTFGSKRALYLEALLNYIAGKRRARGELLDRDLTGRELTHAIGAAVLDEQWTDPGRRACLALAACIEVGQQDPEITTVLETNAADFDAVLALAIRRGQQDGTIRSDLPAEATARAVHAAFDGLQVRSRVATDRASVEADLDAVIALL